DDLVADLLLQAGEAALPEVVVLVEDADLLAREVLLDVVAEDLALDLVARLPAERVRMRLGVVPARAPRRDEQVRDLRRVEVVDDLRVRGRAEPVEDPEDLVLQDELARDADRLGRVVAVVLVGVVDLAAVDAALGVDIREE